MNDGNRDVTAWTGGAERALPIVLIAPRIASLQATQSYIEDVGKLTDSATNRSALAKTLTARQKALQTELAAAQKSVGDRDAPPRSGPLPCGIYH